MNNEIAIQEPALQFVEDKHEYWVGGERYESVTQVIDYWNLVDTRFYPSWARTRGSAVHLACEFEDEGTLDESSIDPRVMGRVQAYRRFKAEIEHVWEMTEARLYHPAYKFAGTLDRAGMMHIDGQLRNVVVDFKSGQMLPCYRLQLAAYVALVITVHKEKNPLAWHRVVLQLKDNGKYVPHILPQNELASDMATFFSYVAAMRWEKAHGLGRKAKKENVA